MSYKTVIMHIILALVWGASTHVGMSIGVLKKFEESVESGVMNYNGKKYHIIPWEKETP